MVLSGEQQVLVDLDPDKPKKQRNPKAVTVKNSEIRDIFDKVLESNQNLKDAQDKVLESNQGLKEAQNKVLESNMDLKDAQDKVLESNHDLKEVQNKLTGALLEVMDKIDTMSVTTEVLAQKVDEIQTGVAACQEEIGKDDDGSEEYQALTSDAVKGFVTTREIFDKYSKQFLRRDGELANKKFLTLMERMCTLRDDYSKLCTDLKQNIGSFSATDVLTSFEAYLVDLENMLEDAGVVIGPYGSDGDQIDVMHQRIVSIVPTTDPAKNGTVAKRISDGYEYDGRAIIKEKVQAYKSNEQPDGPKPQTNDTKTQPEDVKTQTGFRMAPTQ